MGHLELVHPMPAAANAPPRPDHETIGLMVKEGSRVLDLGCGDGALISHLAQKNGVRARGLELDPRNVYACVRGGLAVVQGDIEQDLADVPSGTFDYVIFSHSLQALDRPQDALRHAARIGERVIVSIRNAGHWRARSALFFKGRMPAWNGQVRHTLTVRDFVEFTRGMRLSLERAVPLSHGNAGAPFAKVLWRANWFAEEAVFLFST